MINRALIKITLWFVVLIFWNKNFSLLIYDSLTAHYSPLLDIGLPNFSTSRSIFGYSHPASRPAQILTSLPLPIRGLGKRRERLIYGFLWCNQIIFPRVSHCNLCCNQIKYLYLSDLVFFSNDLKESASKVGGALVKYSFVPGTTCKPKFLVDAYWMMANVPFPKANNFFFLYGTTFWFCLILFYDWSVY
jgi:hypothetical protein